MTKKITLLDIEEFIIGGKNTARPFELKKTINGEVTKLLVNVRPLTYYEATKITNVVINKIENDTLRENIKGMLNGNEESAKKISRDELLMFNFELYATYGAYAIKDSFDADIDDIVQLLLTCDETTLIELKDFIAKLSGTAPDSDKDVEEFHEDEQGQDTSKTRRVRKQE